ncbi:MAG: hypothetical protein JWR50_28 [Mucilaginibacter sp.]|nr:hypothetical protein [Mucilaginibacter sp.]
MKFNNQNSKGSRYKYLLVLAAILTFCSTANLASAKQSKPKVDKKVSQNAIKLTAAQLAMFAGKYRNMDEYVTISVAKGGLILKQLQGKREAISFYPTDLYEFHTNHFGKPYWIMFGGRSNHKIDSFATMDHDIWVRVK